MVALYEDLSPLGSKQFDIVLSNFGGLNCTSNLRGVAEQVSLHLKPGGYAIAVVMPPFSLWETFAYAFRGKIREAIRRIRPNGTETQFSGNKFTVYYFSRRRMSEAFSEQFDVVETYALNVLSPPPHAWNIRRRFPHLTAGLEKIDDLTCHLPLFRSIGDHTVIVMRKKAQSLCGSR